MAVYWSPEVAHATASPAHTAHGTAMHVTSNQRRRSECKYADMAEDEDM
ncbi:MAG: hypothetical protein HQ567_34150 [Candidatus Nealsonbacteria bacterium]|nr:hypothetical protein [Candidatus Nealsonbacteria bacterium]